MSHASPRLGDRARETAHPAGVSRQVLQAAYGLRIGRMTDTGYQLVSDNEA